MAQVLVFFLDVGVFKNIVKISDEGFDEVVVVDEEVEDFPVEIETVKFNLVERSTVIFFSTKSLRYRATICLVSSPMLSMILY